MDKVRVKELEIKISKTVGSRFNASKRLRRRNIYSMWAVSLSSVWVIIYSLLTLKEYRKYLINDSYADYLSIINIFLSIIIIIFSLIESSNNYVLRSDILHTTGKKLNKLKDQLGTIIREDTIDENEVEKIRKKYNKIIKNCSENHETIDYEYHLVYNELDGYEKKRVKGILIKFRYCILEHTTYIISILLPIIIFLLIVKII